MPQRAVAAGRDRRHVGEIVVGAVLRACCRCAGRSRPSGVLSSHGSASHWSTVAARRRSERASRSTAATVLALASSFASLGLLHSPPPRGRSRARCRTRRACRRTASACHPSASTAPVGDVAQIARVKLGEAQRERIIGECRQPRGRAPALFELDHLGARAAFLASSCNLRSRGKDSRRGHRGTFASVLRFTVFEARRVALEVRAGLFIFELARPWGSPCRRGGPPRSRSAIVTCNVIAPASPRRCAPRPRSRSRRPRRCRRRSSAGPCRRRSGPTPPRRRTGRRSARPARSGRGSAA